MWATHGLHGYTRDAAFPENDSTIHNCTKNVAVLPGKVGSGARAHGGPPTGEGGLHVLRVETDAATRRSIAGHRCACSVFVHSGRGKFHRKTQALLQHPAH